MEFRPDDPIDDKALGRKAKSSADNASNKTGVEGAALLWMLILGAVFFLFRFAPLVLRLFFRKNLGLKSFGIIAVFGAYLWTRAFYIGTILCSQPCEIFKFTCGTHLNKIWIIIYPFVEVFGIKNTGGLNLSEFLYPWNIWNPDYPSLLPLYGTIILIFGLVHYIDKLLLPATADRSFYSRGENAFTETLRKWRPSITEVQVRKYVEPVLILFLVLLAFIVGDWRFALAFSFAFICLKFEGFKSHSKNKEIVQSVKEGERKGKQLSESSDDKIDGQKMENEGGHNIAQI